jgi:hypothetical protein
MMAQRRHVGRPGSYDAAAFVLACPGRSSDHVYLFLQIRDTRITAAHWLCHLCDPWMQIAADIVCDLIEGHHTEDVLDLTLADFERVLGGTDAVIAEHGGPAVLVTYRATVDHDVKQALAAGQPHPVTPHTPLRDLASPGRDSLLRLKQAAENRFADCGLHIPRPRLESVSTQGTVQDFSTLVQDLLERWAIDRIRTHGLGFPRSFHETADDRVPSV